MVSFKLSAVLMATAFLMSAVGVQGGNTKTDYQITNYKGSFDDINAAPKQQNKADQRSKADVSLPAPASLTPEGAIGQGVGELFGSMAKGGSNKPSRSKKHHDPKKDSRSNKHYDPRRSHGSKPHHVSKHYSASNHHSKSTHHSDLRHLSKPKPNWKSTPHHKSKANPNSRPNTFKPHRPHSALKTFQKSSIFPGPGHKHHNNLPPALWRMNNSMSKSRVKPSYGHGSTLRNKNVMPQSLNIPQHRRTNKPMASPNMRRVSRDDLGKSQKNEPVIAKSRSMPTVDSKTRLQSKVRAPAKKGRTSVSKRSLTSSRLFRRDDELNEQDENVVPDNAICDLDALYSMVSNDERLPPLFEPMVKQYLPTIGLQYPDQSTLRPTPGKYEHATCRVALEAIQTGQATPQMIEMLKEKYSPRVSLAEGDDSAAEKLFVDSGEADEIEADLLA